jgi:hypothetical protein
MILETKADKVLNSMPSAEYMIAKLAKLATPQVNKIMLETITSFGRLKPIFTF